jgi:hypothetical protein
MNSLPSVLRIFNFSEGWGKRNWRWFTVGGGGACHFANTSCVQGPWVHAHNASQALSPAVCSPGYHKSCAILGTEVLIHSLHRLCLYSLFVPPLAKSCAASAIFLLMLSQVKKGEEFRSCSHAATSPHCCEQLRSLSHCLSFITDSNSMFLFLIFLHFLFLFLLKAKRHSWMPINFTLSGFLRQELSRTAHNQRESVHSSWYCNIFFNILYIRPLL